MKTIITDAASAVSSAVTDGVRAGASAVNDGVRTAVKDPMGVMAANPLRSFVHMHATAQPSLACLNTFLRSESAAVEIIRLVADRIEVYPFQSQLREMLISHERRVEALRLHIGHAGGKPIPANGWWIIGQRLLGRLTLLASEKSALRLIAGREMLTLRTYQGQHTQLDEDASRMLAYELLPEQEKSAAIMAGLAKKL